MSAPNGVRSPTPTIQSAEPTGEAVTDITDNASGLETRLIRARPGSPRLPGNETGVERLPASRPTIGVALNRCANWKDKGIVLVNCDSGSKYRATNPQAALPSSLANRVRETLV